MILITQTNRKGVPVEYAIAEGSYWVNEEYKFIEQYYKVINQKIGIAVTPKTIQHNYPLSKFIVWETMRPATLAEIEAIKQMFIEVQKVHNYLFTIKTSENEQKTP